MSMFCDRPNKVDGNCGSRNAGRSMENRTCHHHRPFNYRLCFACGKEKNDTNVADIMRKKHNVHMKPLLHAKNART